MKSLLFTVRFENATVCRLKPQPIAFDRKNIENFNYNVTIFSWGFCAKFRRKKITNAHFRNGCNVLFLARADFLLFFTSITIYMQINKLTCMPHTLRAVEMQQSKQWITANKQPYSRIFYVDPELFSFRNASSDDGGCIEMESLDWIFNA